jgi:MoxR-like ATPase
VDDTVIYQLGVIPTAIELANEYGKAIVCFEEFNTLTPNMQKVTNQLLDFRHHAYVPALGKTFKVNEGCELGIFATCNPDTYGGTYELNEDLYSRLTTYDMSYPQREEEVNILQQLYEEYEDELGDTFPQFVTLAVETRMGYNKNDYHYALSTRDICYLVSNYIYYKEHLESISYEDPDLKAMSLVRKVFLSKYDESEAEKETAELAWTRAMGDIEDFD